ncbi:MULTISPECIES: NEL-type E3 ubiquitin ligase domain-containing protein [unclassified Pseudomonas]|uniref:NEL-type E3 ubiquitin ligase domain-containing protein n=1 Tax=unclassified Pseudomonas TaxID=196821 RepID=UPI00380DBE3F
MHHLQQAVPARDSSTFLEKLRDCLQPIDWASFTPMPGHQGGQAERVRDPEAWVAVTLQPFNRPLIDERVSQKRQRHLGDIAFHAVSTAQEDQKSAEKRKAYFAQLAFGALNIGAFVVPGLGQLMLGLSVIQLSYEVFEGIESWADDDRGQALDYLMDIVENVALTAALAATGVADGTPATERIPVEAPSFIEELAPVVMPDGTHRLWLPDLKPFAHDILLPAGLQPDEFGVYHHEGSTWLALDGNTYSVTQAPDSGGYRVVHPTKPLSYEPPLRHNGAGAWLHPADKPEQWQALMLLRRAGHLSGQFDDETALRILHVSGTQEDVLRQVFRANQQLPGPLQDTLSRFSLYQALQALPELAEPGQLHAAFEKHYRQLPAPQAPGAAAVQDRYPQLPPPVTAELIRHASPAELEALSKGNVPLRLAEEIRPLQQQVRLNRAYEGLYLERVRNWDTDVLVLHTLEQLPGWSADTRITLEQRQHSPAQFESIGRDDMPGKSIISARAGYAVLDSHKPDELLCLHDSLYGALFEVLTPAQGMALGVEDQQVLKRLVQQAPLLPRATLRQALGMQSVRPGWRSPMRLADGRPGYPLGGTRPRATSFSRQTLLNVIRQIGQDAPVTRPAEHILTALENRNLTRAQIDEMLRHLLEQRNQLRSTLAEWRHNATLMPDQTPDGFERQMTAISQYWYERAFLPPDTASAPLRLEHLSLAQFPLQLPDFFTASVTDLQLIETSPATYQGWNLHAPQLHSLLRQFANLRSLDISRPYQPEALPSAFQFSLPAIAQHLPALESLALTHQNISLSAVDIESLGQLTRLRRLDLSGNRISGHFPPLSSALGLDYLGLDNMALDHWPQWLGEDTVTHVRHITLRHNQIRNLPRFLRDNRINMANHALISLQGNQIIDTDMLSVLLAEDGRAARFEMDLTEDFRARLALQLNQRQQLRDFIDNYVNASSSSAPVSHAAMASRTRVATALNEFWHFQEIGLTRAALRLNDMALEHFPRRLPAFFTSQVHNLVLESVSGSTAQLDAVLSQFGQVTRLTVDDYQQAEQTLPSAVLRLPRLTDMALRQSGLLIDQTLMNTLGRLTTLNSLDLTGNQMGSITQAPASLRSLRRLDLNNMALDHWPAWVDSLFPLEMLDLSENRLSELPPHILANLGNDFPISSILLFSNPLSDATIMRARASSDSQRSFTFALDLSDSTSETTESSEEGLMGGHFHLPFLDPAADAPNVNDWLLASDVENQALKDCWEQLQASGGAESLLALVGRLRNAAPYQNGKTRVSFCERVRKVLVGAIVNPDDLALFNEQASEALPQDNGDQTCHDGALLVFQNIELFIANQRLQIDAVDTEANLYRELRRLYRLQALDDVAKSETGNRDEAEVRLTYRRELNATLGLGQPDDTLRYAINASIGELTYAEFQVQRGELGEEFLNFAASNTRWVQHLRQTYTERFAEIEQTYQRQVNELPDQYPDRSLDRLDAEFEALERSKQARELRLIRELTSFANPDRRPRSSTE